jgi:ABC-type Fe3+-hydroxamate transport system substrate-binding protein
MSSPILTDQAGYPFSFSGTAKRIVSLVPSQTELLFALGAGPQVVGITRFCIHPADKVKSVPRVGGTKKVRIEKIKALQPDIVIGNKEENTQADVAALQQLCPVWLSDVQDFLGACHMIEAVGSLIGSATRAQQLVEQLTLAHHSLTSGAAIYIPALYLIWKKPWMLAGKSTFIDAMMQYAGLKNCTEALRYPAFEDPKALTTTPKVVLLSSEPYPFQAKHIPEIQALFPEAVVCLADGTYFSWYGSRMLEAFPYLASLRRDLLEALGKNG